ncbi:eukaryotic translation initiation factor 5B isoform X2 [Rhodnius prolixus]|uniref:eukaryotic translation initiation factor 5B isoform X2 n=1 Tax=Rhodnius prolixus TaxID=13249 RepID=UPI003D18F5A0
MGKAKKGRKVDNDDNATKDVEVDSESEDEAQGKKKKSKKKNKVNDEAEKTKEAPDVGINSKGKKEKRKGKTSESADEEEIKMPSVMNKTTGVGNKKTRRKSSLTDSDGEEEIQVAPAKEKTRFALLAISDDEDGDEEDKASDNDISDNVEEEEKKPAIKKKDDKKGSKKSKKKKKESDDEDLEKILAELEVEYAGGVVTKSDAPKEELKEEVKDDKKQKKKKKDVVEQPSEDVEEGDGDVEGADDEVRTVKTAAQKKKEKKEREKQKKLAEKAKTKEQTAGAPEPQKQEIMQVVPEPTGLAEELTDKLVDPQEEGEDDDDDDKKKKKKKKKGEKEEKEKPGKPKKKAIAAMQEALKKIKEEEERLAAEEAEKLKKEEEAERARQEQLRLEQERKERRKQKEKERKERLKAEGKLLSSKQKADRARAQGLIEAMKAMRVAGGPGASKDQQMMAPKPKPFTKLKRKQFDGPKNVHLEIVDTHTSNEQPATPTEPVPTSPVLLEEDEDVKDSWDVESDKEEDKSEESSKDKDFSEEAEIKPSVEPVELKVNKTKKEETESEESSESDETESESETESEEEHENKKTDAEKKREKVIERIKKRQENAEKKRSVDELRAAVVCVLGHVDTGKTKILDKLRRTNVQDGEAGGITQQIGATNVPIDAIKDQAKIVKGFSQLDLKIPGLLIIDTPGHESFSNLRSRGSSLCDIAILVVDIMHGLEPQTIESLNLLKQRKTPFIVALNKIDRLYDWQTINRKDIRDVIKAQAANTQLEFEQRTNEVIVQFAEQGLNAALFYNNPDVRSYVSLVPTSAITGEGMGNLLALIVESCQTMLAKRLAFSEELQATVLEVKAISGLGTTIDVILVNGYLREGDTVVLAGTEAPIVTQIRSLLMPQPLKELRVKNAYVEYKEIKAAQGVKIAGKDLEKVIAGLNLRVAEMPDEVDLFKEEVSKELKRALSSIKLKERGVYVQASTLGSLEALLEFLRTSNIPYANIRIGPVVKKDVVKASTMLEHDSQYAVILAFDVKIERDAQDMADNLGVKIFQADIIYHLFDKFIAYREELKAKKREEYKTIAVFPCKLRILPQFVFNSRDPIVVGVIVEAGIVKEGTPICVPSKEFVELGIVTSIENNHKAVGSARKGQEVCIKIEPIPGESPKMFGRHFDEKDFLVSKISRQSIDACKEYFRDDLVKTDWHLMLELKNLFQIL